MAQVKIEEVSSHDSRHAGHSSLCVSSRRQFLTGMAALGAAALLLPAGSLLEAAGIAAAPQAGGAKKVLRRIDVHHHPSLPNATPQARTTQTGPAPSMWTPETALKMMDEGEC